MASKKKGEGKAVTPKPTGKTEMQEQTETQSEVTDVKADDSKLEIGANESAPAADTAQDEQSGITFIDEVAFIAPETQEQSGSEEAPSEEKTEDAPAADESKPAQDSAPAEAPAEQADVAKADETVEITVFKENEAGDASVAVGTTNIPVVEETAEAALDPQPEVTPVPGDTDADAPEVVAEPEPVVLSGKAAVLARLHSQGPAHLSGLRSMLIGYLDVMGNERRTTPEEQLLQQKLFRTALFSLLKLRGQEFVTALDELLVVISAHRDFVFKEKYVYREIKNLPVSAEERNVLVNLITLLLTIAEPSTRSLALNQIDLGSALKGLRGEDEIRALFHEFITRGL